jgi:signal transduction histidine kinase/CheY-like chemotaxis protein
MLRKISIGTRLLIAFSIAVFFTLIVGLTGLTRIYSIKSSAAKMMGNINELNSMYDYNTEINVDMYNMLHISDTMLTNYLMQITKENIAKLHESFDIHIKATDQYQGIFMPGEIQNIKNLREIFKEAYVPVLQEIFDLVERGQRDEAASIYVNRFYPIYGTFVYYVNSAFMRNLEYSLEETAKNDKNALFSMYLMLFVILLSIIVLTALGFAVTKSIYIPLRREAAEAKRQKEKAEAASKSKSDFLAKMSHEIRTPMNAITGMAELALREDSLAAAKKHVFTIKQAGANLLSIINDILDFSKIESGKMKLVPTDYMFSSLVNDAVSITRMKIMDSRLNFVVNIDSNIPNALRGDETRIRQVLLNVLSNAAKYTKKGFVSFSVTGEITSEDTVLLTIDVTDSGKGIKREDMEKLFEDFSQVDTATNRGVEGTGLGLAITRNLTQAMGGDIKVYSEYGKGSTFTIELPQKIRSIKPLAAVENPEKKNILVYEQNEIYADSIVCAVDNLGVECERVENDEALRKKLKNKSYSFIFASKFLLENVKKAMEEFKSNAQIVLLADFGDSVSDENLSVLAMPAQSISIANILNGISDSFSYSTNENATTRFTAPSVKILVVDDIGTNLKVAEGLMAPYKMKVDLCQSGIDAIEAVKETRYDLVFMDHMMPEMDGIETTRRIRELGKTLPIIALTANAVSGVKEMFLSNGFNDFLSKPIDTVKLNSILAKWIPKEKQEKRTNIEEKIIDESSLAAESIKIEGIDVKKGIKMVGGMLELYMQTLAVFHKDGLQKIEEIKKSLETKNYSLYATYVHALKSASANIGAIGLSEAAKELEMASKQADSAFVILNNSKFLASLEILLNDIGQVLASNKKKQQGPVDLKLLKSELNKLEKALIALDSNAIDEAAGNLQKFAQADEVGTSVENILQSVLIGEYDEAVAMIKSTLPYSLR